MSAMIEPSEEDPLLSVNQVARIFSVTGYTVRVWCKSGKLKGTKLGRDWRILQSEMVRFANENYGSRR